MFKICCRTCDYFDIATHRCRVTSEAIANWNTYSCDNFKPIGMESPLKDVVMTLSSRRQLYEVEPVSIMLDSEIMAVIRMKYLRAKFGKDHNKRVDDLLDMIVYGLKLLERWWDGGKTEERSYCSNYERCGRCRN